MRHPIRRHAGIVILVLSSTLGTWLTPSSVSAQSDADRATARALAEEGYNALRSQKFDIAADRFRRADALIHAPTLVVDQGRALIGLGRYLDAQEKFELVLREGVAENAPAVWKAAVAEAAKLLEEVKPKVAWLTIVVPNIQHPNVEIGGRAISEAAIGVKFALNPGGQTIRVTADGYEPKTQSLLVGEGSEQTLEIMLVRSAHVEPKSNVTPDAPKEPSDGAGSGTKTAAYVAFGAGAASIIAGSITGGLALQKRSNLTSICVNGQCPGSAESTLSGYHTLGTLSGVGLGLGVVGLATGFLLYSTAGSSSERTHAATSELKLQVGPQSFQLQGKF